MLSVKMISPYYFANISINITPNNKKMDILITYKERAIEKSKMDF